MNLHLLRIYVKVVEVQSFSRAAEALDITQPAVSKALRELEDQLDVVLIERGARIVSLTEAGAEIHQACLRLVADAQAVQALAGQLRQQPRGLLKISAPAVLGDIWLSPLLPGFCARWPEVQVQVDMTDRMVDLVAEGLDLGLRISVPGQIAPGLVARPLKTIRYVLVATPGYLARHAQITEPGQLLAHPFISLGYGQFQNEVELRPLHPAAAPATRLLVDTPITIASSLGIIQALQQGQGIGVVADFAAQAALQAGQLAPVLPGWALCGKYAPRVVHAVYAPTRHVPLKLRALIDYLVEVEGDGATAPAT